MRKGIQVENGKAFEYAIAKEYRDYILQQGCAANLLENAALFKAKHYYEGLTPSQRRRFDCAAHETINTLVKIEPGLLAQRNNEDVLTICLQKDQEGEQGDVRDVIFSRELHGWEIGFSAKNNNDAVKHSRLSKIGDFGLKWLGIPCSDTYWNDVLPLFDELDNIRRCNPNALWRELGERKQDDFYIPILEAFRKELLRINDSATKIPAKLVSYLIGEHPFYKIIKDDKHNMVIVKAFNIKGGLNQTVSNVKSRYKIPVMNLPERIVDFEFKKNSKDTLIMILDGGWEISFRIHSADSKVEASLKFDVRLLGNPPILFTQYLFQELL